MDNENYCYYSDLPSPMAYMQALIVEESEEKNISNKSLNDPEVKTTLPVK